MGIKKKKTFTQIVAVGGFLIFPKCLMTAKALLKLKKVEFYFSFLNKIKKNIDAEVTRTETGNYYFFLA